jgi:sulfite reductase (NADPH) flavoprotein alpha-component
LQHIPSIPENAPFNTRQRLWLNGYLAGLFAASAGPGVADEIPAQPTMPVLIIYGSQTGTAEGLARRVSKEAKLHRGNPRVVDASAHASIDWKAESNLLVITSTYGDGDMPDNAQGFWDWLQTENAGALAHLKFSVLALGDTSYEHFCDAGKKIDARLEQLGAKRIHPRTDCDLDYEAAAKAWMDGVLPALSATKQENKGQAGNGNGHSSLLLPSEENGAESRTSPVVFSRNNPFPARLLTNRRLNGEGSGKETRHFEISLEGSGLSYDAGDALGIYPSNCPALVDDLLRALDCDGEEAVPGRAGGEIPLRMALTTACDITKPSAELLQRAAADNTLLRELLAPDRKDDLRTWLRGREVIDLLLETKGVCFAPAEFVGLLKRLAPRLYSISSSPKAHLGQVHLTVSIVRHESHGRARKGVCSTFLADRAGEITPVPVFFQASHGFRLPANGDTPVIMVGPGTGIAPFRAFLHERRATGAKGRNWLFFGEQRAAADFYYREEFEQMLADGHLTKLSTAFSRDQADKVYVQHRTIEHAAELWAWLQDGAHFYVCGDASRMAKDVDAALHTVMETAGGLGREGAAEAVKQLKSGKRYQRDVY